MPFILNCDPTPLASQSDEEVRPAPTVGLGEFLLRVCQRFFFGFAVHGAEALADPGKPIGRPGLGGLTLTHVPDVVAFTIARKPAIVPRCEAPAPSRPTLANMRTQSCWLRVNCLNTTCLHRAPVALAPLITRWGEEASSDLLRRAVRCARCGRKGASLTSPSWVGLDTGFAPFPADRT